MSGVKHSFRSGGMIVAHQRKRYTSGLGTDLAKTGAERSPKSSPLRRALRAIGLTRAGKPRNCRICRLSFRIAVQRTLSSVNGRFDHVLKKITTIGDSWQRAPILPSLR